MVSPFSALQEPEINAPPPGERITQAEFARRMGVNKSTVHKWVKGGRITLGKDGLLDYAQARREQELTASPTPMHQARKAAFDAERTARAEGQPQSNTGNATTAAPGPHGGIGGTQPLSASGLTSLEGIGAAMKFETYRLQKAKAENANLELDKAAGLLVERVEVDFVLDDLGKTLRSALESLADRLAPTLAGHQGDVTSIHKLIDDAARELLEGIAEHMARRQEELTR